MLVAVVIRRLTSRNGKVRTKRCAREMRELSALLETAPDRTEAVFTDRFKIVRSQARDAQQVLAALCTTCPTRERCRAPLR